MRIPKLSTIASISNFLIINFSKLSTTKDIPIFQQGHYSIRGCLYNELEEANNVYKIMNGKSFSSIHKLLLKFFSEKILIIVKDNTNNKIVALNLYYVNKRDIKDKTIHAAFIGVLDSYQGQGLATSMRTQAQLHFRNSGYSGLSSKISKNNIASFKGALKVGYKPTEEFYDNTTGEDRYYLICNLRKRNYDN